MRRASSITIQYRPARLTLASCSSRSAFCAVRRLTRASTWSTSSDVAGAAAAGMLVMAYSCQPVQGSNLPVKGP
jgi:hypothetical protein